MFSSKELYNNFRLHELLQLLLCLQKKWVGIYDLALVLSSEHKRLNSQGCSAINLEEGNKLVVHTLETFIQVTIQQFSDQFMFVVSLSAF